MPWGRFGDDAFTYPRLLAVAGIPGAPASAVNEVFGFFSACILQSAAHVTDYVVNVGAVQTAGRSRHKKLLEWSVRVGLMTPVEIDGMPHWVLLDDPKFVHIRTQAELDAEAFTRDVRGKPHLAVAVLLRDGDNCRYCGIQVLWDGRKSARSAQFDHRDPGQPGTVETVVVACKQCNGERLDNRHGWDATHPLKPPPEHPQYGKNTAAFLTKNGHRTEPNAAPATLRTTAADTAGAALAPRPATTPSTPHGRSEARRPAASEKASANAPYVEVSNSPESADPGSIETGSAGKGRAGSGPGPVPGPTTRRRRRARRGAGLPEDPAADEPCCAKPYPHHDEDGSVLCLTCETRRPR